MPLIKVQLTEDEIRHIKKYEDDCNSANVGFRVASSELKRTGQYLWEELEKLRPGCKGTGATYHGKEGGGFISYFKDEKE